MIETLSVDRMVRVRAREEERQKRRKKTVNNALEDTNALLRFVVRIHKAMHEARARSHQRCNRINGDDCPIFLLAQERSPFICSTEFSTSFTNGPARWNGTLREPQQTPTHRGGIVSSQPAPQSCFTQYKNVLYLCRYYGVPSTIDNKI